VRFVIITPPIGPSAPGARPAAGSGDRHPRRGPTHERCRVGGRFQPERRPERRCGVPRFDRVFFFDRRAGHSRDRSRPPAERPRSRPRPHV